METVAERLDDEERVIVFFIHRLRHGLQTFLSDHLAAVVEDACENDLGALDERSDS